MKKKLPISVCMLSLNEADRFPLSLTCIDHFEEWLIYDTGSTDNSIQIGQDAGATVTKQPWLGFSKTRELQFTQASQPWILWLDADEVITQALIDELYQLFDNELEPQHSAFEINRMIYFNQQWVKHGDWFPDWNVRLFKKDVWSMPERDVHESVDINGSKGKLHNILEHHSFRSWNDKEQRSNKYAKLWVDMQLNKGGKVLPCTPLLRGVWKFLRGYILKKGFLDRSLGFKIALSNAKETTYKYKLLQASLNESHS
ncbi:MAG: glycosyltransferase involved in cell wall biosynthesis [Cryomorphaceae bacterium]|jgi:glycosyltransferase involved in cell wall biosynthesis